MGMVVRTNTMALNAYRQLGMNNSAVAKSLEKLSSGFRINRAGDDAAGLAISEKMKAQIKGLETASANAQDGISLIQTAEGNLAEVHDMLNRMVELATKSANGTYTQQERDALQSEVDQLLDEIDRISQSANFNGAKLLDGTMGLNSDAFSNITLNEKSDFSKLLGAEGSSGVHLETVSSSAKTVGAAIDLSGIKLATSSVTNGEVTLKLGDMEFSITVASGVIAISGTQISAFMTEIGKSDVGVSVTDGQHNATATNNTAIKLGTGVYTMAASGSAITLTMSGYFDEDGEFQKSTGTDLDQATADKINKDLGMSVDVAVKDRSFTNKNWVPHALTKVDHAVSKATQQFAGIDLKLDSNIVSDGNVLNFDGVSFIFKTLADDETSVQLGTGVTQWSVSEALKPASDFTDAEGRIIINVGNYDSDEEKIHAAADWMTKVGNLTGMTNEAENGRSWLVGVRDDNTIHFEQKAATDTDTNSDAKVLKTYKDLTDLFKFEAAGVNPFEKATTTMKIDATKIVAGDALNIGGKTYTFVESASEATAKGTTKVVLGEKGKDAIKNLVSALKGNGVDAVKTGDSIKIYAAEKTDKTGPVISGGGLTLQIGDTADIFNKMTVAVDDMSADGLGLKGLKITGEALASKAIQTIKDAINTVSTTRAGMGALQNRLEHTINNLDVTAENLSSANSRIRDTDMAKEMMNYTKMNVLVQSAQAMLAQANQQPQSVLQLLQ